MICIQKKHWYILALTFCFINKQHAMDQKPNQQITWSESIRGRLSKLAQQSEDSYADIRQSYLRQGYQVQTIVKPDIKTTQKK